MKNAKLIVAYPQPKDMKAFEAVYQGEHVPMAIANLAGKTRIVATKILQSPQGEPPCYCIAEIHIPSMDAPKQCAASAGGKETLIYGVLSYSVSRRTREIGLRMAIGAQRAAVMQLVVREGMLVALAGIGAGVAGALAVSRALATLLFGVQSREPRNFRRRHRRSGNGGAGSLLSTRAQGRPRRPMVALRDE